MTAQYAEYTDASLDKSEGSRILGTKAFRDQNVSLDKTTIIVRHRTGEEPWPGAILLTNAEARARLQSTDFTPEPTDEEKAQEAQALREFMEEKVKRVANRKLGRRFDELIGEDIYVKRLEEAVADYDANGSNAMIETFATAHGFQNSRARNTANDYVTNINAIVDAVMPIALAGIAAARNDRDVQPFIDAIEKV